MMQGLSTTLGVRRIKGQRDIALVLKGSWGTVITMGVIEHTPERKDSEAAGGLSREGCSPYSLLRGIRNEYLVSER